MGPEFEFDPVFNGYLNGAGEGSLAQQMMTAISYISTAYAGTNGMDETAAWGIAQCCNAVKDELAKAEVYPDLVHEWGRIADCFYEFNRQLHQGINIFNWALKDYAAYQEASQAAILAHAQDSSQILEGLDFSYGSSKW